MLGYWYIYICILCTRICVFVSPRKSPLFLLLGYCWRPLCPSALFTPSYGAGFPGKFCPAGSVVSFPLLFRLSGAALSASACEPLWGDEKLDDIADIYEGPPSFLSSNNLKPLLLFPALRQPPHRIFLLPFSSPFSGSLAACTQHYHGRHCQPSQLLAQPYGG
jgi:hypothetical protein